MVFTGWVCWPLYLQCKHMGMHMESRHSTFSAGSSCTHEDSHCSSAGKRPKTLLPHGDRPRLSHLMAQVGTLRVITALGSVDEWLLPERVHRYTTLSYATRQPDVPLSRPDLAKGIPVIARFGLIGSLLHAGYSGAPSDPSSEGGGGPDQGANRA